MLTAFSVARPSARRRFLPLLSLVGGLFLAGGEMGCTSPNAYYGNCALSGDCDSPNPGDPDLGEQPGDLGRPPVNSDGGSGDLLAASDGGGGSIDPGSAGPRGTVQFDIQVAVTGGNTQGTVIGPSDDGKTIATRGGPFPLVLLSPGFTLDRKKYVGYGQRLASYGIITVLQKAPSEFDHAKYRDTTDEFLSWLLSPKGTGADKIMGRIDASKVGLVGHSLGGKISILVAAKDARVTALMGIDPVDLNNPQSQTEIGKIRLPASLPIGLLGETTNKSGGFMPCAPAGNNFETLYDKASPPAFAITFVGAAHLDFQDNCDANCARFCPGGMAPRDRTNSLAIKYVAAYFLWGLKGEASARSYILGADFQKDVTAGYVTQVTK